MNISKISATPPSKASFGAKLYNSKGEQIKEFLIIGLPTPFVDMNERGSANTDIFVKNVFSKKNSMGAYENYVNLKIENPLFGEQSFIQRVSPETNRPVEKQEEAILLERLTKNTENLENKALRKAITEQTNNCNTREKKAATEVLNAMLHNVSAEEHGFSEERISEFKAIAENINH